MVVSVGGEFIWEFLALILMSLNYKQFFHILGKTLMVWGGGSKTPTHFGRFRLLCFSPNLNFVKGY